MRAKRRRLETGFKAKVGLEAGKGIKTVEQITREYQVHPNHVNQWKSEVSQRLPEVFETGPTVQIREREKEKRESFLPRFAIVDTARHGDAKKAWELWAGLLAGEIVVFDKAYLDLLHLFELFQRGVNWA